MTQDEEQVLNEMLQMDQMGQFVQTPTPGYGLFPATGEPAATPAPLPTISAPQVTT
jgi:hypothetical protein